jgi:hypothetical protein
VCPRLFYLESADFLDDEVLAEVAAAAAFQEEPAVQESATAAAATALVVSLHALAGIRT